MPKTLSLFLSLRIDYCFLDSNKAVCTISFISAVVPNHHAQHHHHAKWWWTVPLGRVTSSWSLTTSASFGSSENYRTVSFGRFRWWISKIVLPFQHVIIEFVDVRARFPPTCWSPFWRTGAKLTRAVSVSKSTSRANVNFWIRFGDAFIDHCFTNSGTIDLARPLPRLLRSNYENIVQINCTSLFRPKNGRKWSRQSLLTS